MTKLPFNPIAAFTTLHDSSKHADREGVLYLR